MAMDGMIQKSVQREILRKGQRFPGSKNPLDTLIGAILAAILIIAFALALFGASFFLFLFLFLIIIEIIIILLISSIRNKLRLKKK